MWCDGMSSAVAYEFMWETDGFNSVRAEDPVRLYDETTVIALTNSIAHGFT